MRVTAACRVVCAKVAASVAAMKKISITTKVGSTCEKEVANEQKQKLDILTRTVSDLFLHV